jgi:MoxR-like ATPase
MNDEPLEINRQAVQLRPRLEPLFEEIGKVIVGQRPVLERLLIGLLTGGHVLLEGVPGLAKTLIVRSLAQACRLRFQRIQFTPDLLPADIIGTQIYNPRTGDFTVRKGPLFANLVLADEINRAPAKVQSALLEAMQEQQVTIGDETFPLPTPFLVLATQNPIEHEGTYPLPEAQLDRFMLKAQITYPSTDEEVAIVDRMAADLPEAEVQPVLEADDLTQFQDAVAQTYVDPKIKRYAVDIVAATRRPQDFGMDIASWIEFGASPRATVFLVRAAKAMAFLSGRGYVTPQDIKSIGYDVLRHRILLTYEADAEAVNAEQVLTRIFNNVRVP